MTVASQPTHPLVLRAHGSADPRAAAVTHAVAGRIRRLRPGLDVRAAFSSEPAPNLRDVLTDLDGDAVVVPILLADAYHARVDIPSMIEDAGVPVRAGRGARRGPRPAAVMRQRLAETGVSPTTTTSA